MTKTDASDEIGTARVENLETLRRRVSDLAGKADAAAQSYDRTFWIRYAAIFFPIPFVVVLFRVHMQAWHYYIAGALFLAAMIVMYAMDLVAVEKREAAVQAAQRAREAYDAARVSQCDAG
jgi:hypothetical protein